MKKLFLPLSIIAAVSFSSCGGESNEATEETTVEETAEPTCFYAFDANNETSVKWTAFKTNEKIGVGGQFDEVMVTGGEKSTKITDVINTIKFSITTASTNTTNEARDKKIIDSFFGTMVTTDLIIGQLENAEGDNNSGTCKALLTLNNVEKEVTLKYTLTDNVLNLTGEMNINDFDAQSSLTALNEVCSEKHTGKDGESITWPNVELNITSTLSKDCH